MTLETLGLYVLFGGFALTALAETVWPKYCWSPRERWRHLLRNLVLWASFIVVVSLLANWVLAPMTAATRLYRLGLLNLWSTPYWLAWVVGFLFADFSDYVLHRGSHRFRPLWLLHAVHHSDTRLDVSTSLRQHPLFFAATLSIRVLLLLALGAPIEALAVRDLCGVANSHLHHAAIAWTANGIARWQRWVGWLVVTPAAHWAHHDPTPELTDSNFGQVLSCWDHLFGTFYPPELLIRDSGLDALRDERWQTVRGMLLTPWSARHIDRL